MHNTAGKTNQCLMRPRGNDNNAVKKKKEINMTTYLKRKNLIIYIIF